MTFCFFYGSAAHRDLHVLTLFPSTTRFRSLVLGQDGRCLVLESRSLLQVVVELALPGLQDVGDARQGDAPDDQVEHTEGDRQPDELGRPEDRQSTRLNSSQ